MKSVIQNLTATAAVVAALAAAAPVVHAANVTLDGVGRYTLFKQVTYYRNPPAQSGRYSSLGSDYYHTISYSMDFVTNRSDRRSGSLSFEFWAMPFFGSTSGIILMTRGVNRLEPRQSIKELYKTGAGIYLDRRRFPEINLWEFTRRGWKFKDSLTFTRKVYL